MVCWGDLFYPILVYAYGHLFDLRSFKRTQKRTQNAMTLMPFLTLLPLRSLEIQAG